MVKILFFIESLRAGGKERRLVELIKGLSKNNSIQMELVITKRNIHYDEVFNTNVKIHYTIRKDIKKDPRVFLKFYQIAKKFNPDIIHVWGNMVAIYSIPTKFLLNIPLINSQITDAPLKLKKSFLGHKLTFSFSDLILANSFAGLKAYNAPPKKSMVIYNGFDFSRLRGLELKSIVKKRLKITTKYIIGMVASFSDLKDYKSYIEAAENVLSEGVEATFLCIGEGELENYKKLVSERNINRILFLGRQLDVESIMNICDIGVLSTHSEGISNSLLEFMALGKPVISNNSGGTPELIENNKSGFLIERKNVDEMSRMIIKLLNDEKLREEFGIRSKEIVKNRFNNKNMIFKFENLFQKYVASNK